MVWISDLTPVLVGVGIVAAIWAVLSMISNRNSKAVERLQRMSRPQSLAELEDPSKAKKADKYYSLVETAKAISSPMMPKTEAETNDLKTKLANAGFRSDAAPMVYSGLRMGCLGVFALFACILFLPGASALSRKAQMIFIFAGFGFYLPAVILWWLRTKRQEEIFLTLPDALDLLVVCVEAGVGDRKSVV